MTGKNGVLILIIRYPAQERRTAMLTKIERGKVLKLRNTRRNFPISNDAK